MHMGVRSPKSGSFPKCGNLRLFQQQPVKDFTAMELKAIPTTLTELPDVLRVIEGTLNLDTQEESTALSVLAGLRYYLSVEFAREQPGLDLLYCMELRVTGGRHGR